MLQETSFEYGVDWEGPIPADEYEGSNNGEVPETAVPICLDIIDFLDAIDPLSYSDQYGIDLYIRLLNSITSDE